jgi:hypothetical protein
VERSFPPRRITLSIVPNDPYDTGCIFRPGIPVKERSTGKYTRCLHN